MQVKMAKFIIKDHSFLKIICVDMLKICEMMIQYKQVDDLLHPNSMK